MPHDASHPRKDDLRHLPMGEDAAHRLLSQESALFAIRQRHRFHFEESPAFQGVHSFHLRSEALRICRLLS